MALPDWVRRQAAERLARVEAAYRIQVNARGDSVSVIALTNVANPQWAGICSIDRIDGGHGWVSRVKTGTRHRGGGLGEAVLHLALLECEAQGFRRVVVAPGGYDTPIVLLCRWYRLQGFTECPDDAEILFVEF